MGRPRDIFASGRRLVAPGRGRIRTRSRCLFVLLAPRVRHRVRRLTLCGDRAPRDSSKSPQSPIRTVAQAAAHGVSRPYAWRRRVSQSRSKRDSCPIRRAGAQGFQHRPLRIGIDATCWRMRRGFGRHARCLLGAMLEVDPGNEYLFFIDSDEVAGELPSDVRTRVVGPSTPSSRSGARRPRDLLRAAMAMSAAPLDVIVFPAIYSYVPVFSRARKIVMVHDTTADEYPEFALHSRCARVLWSLKGMLARRQADALLE